MIYIKKTFLNKDDKQNWLKNRDHDDVIQYQELPQGFLLIRLDKSKECELINLRNSLVKAGKDYNDHLKNHPKILEQTNQQVAEHIKIEEPDWYGTETMDKSCQNIFYIGEYMYTIRLKSKNPLNVMIGSDCYKTNMVLKFLLKKGWSIDKLDDVFKIWCKFFNGKNKEVRYKFKNIKANELNVDLNLANNIEDTIATLFCLLQSETRKLKIDKITAS